MTIGKSVAILKLRIPPTCLRRILVKGNEQFLVILSPRYFIYNTFGFLREPSGSRWFNFNDARIRATNAAEIEKQFSGKESAYMLFYRRKSLSRPPDGWSSHFIVQSQLLRCFVILLIFSAEGNPFFKVPQHLCDEMLEENAKLENER